MQSQTITCKEQAKTSYENAKIAYEQASINLDIALNSLLTYLPES